jgi:hypothetical protein
VLVLAFAASCGDLPIPGFDSPPAATSSSSAVSSSGAGGSGGAEDASGGGGGSGGMAEAGADADAGADVEDAREEPDAPIDCGTIVEEHMVQPSPHVPVCTPLVYSTNPPTSGPHYPIWAAYKSYTEPVPRGFWVHDLEHGAVVVTYNCPSNCDAEVAQLQAFLDSLPADPICAAPVKNRFVVTPDPHLDIKFAASAWGFSLRSACFDLPPLGTFITDHYAKATEDTCFDGVDVTSPDAGVPPGCGEPVDSGVD